MRLIMFDFYLIKSLARRKSTVTNTIMNKKFQVRFIHFEIVGNFSLICLSHSSTYFKFCSLSGNCYEMACKACITNKRPQS
jgi:hypothetical protein